MADEVIDLRALQSKMTPRVIVIIIGVIIVLIAAFSSFYMVDQKEKAVVLLFGKYNRTAGPGLHFKLPFGIEKNKNVPTGRNLTEEFGFRTEKAGIVTTYARGNYSAESYMLSGDLNIAEVTWIIQYQIKDPKAWLFNVQDQVKTIRDISQSVVNLLVGDLAVFDVVTTQRTQIEEDGRVMMNKFFNEYGLGITVITVKLQKTMYPKGAVQDAFEDVNKSIQDRIRLINEGKEAFNREIPKTRGEAKKITQEAEGYAVERVNKAKGDVARFLAVLSEYKKNPAITRIRLYYEMYEEVFNNTEQTDLIDKQLKNFIPFKSLTPTKKGDDQ
ncbi:MAG: FtsH protease activity modulator HflK [Candidatus Aminicenantes bacterium]|nr:FtsH protease activity modulator HflK [Candidatus Aminicenantes bacterium]NIM82236.1 FtsH protease activity modulator HflK [Candidatus Aminicenantes bacterium]NIN20649.1 FtsH protease activity modulator HflK [Candidatus Aminicenantes bacterium]NIN44428.1 FtsH protease activity modulator HflK [Candidatus Aminicenantes bacterium]NIN87247.1 FtsH protease activity modulator HflK [Candidatus Aminicenantes bacterium]